MTTRKRKRNADEEMWKRIERMHLRRLEEKILTEKKGGGEGEKKEGKKEVILDNVHERINKQKIAATEVLKNDYLIKNYLCKFFQSMREWRPQYRDEMLRFLAGFDGRRTKISMHVLFYLVQNLMDFFFWKNDPPGYLVQDPEYLVYVSRAFYVEEDNEVDEWFAFLRDQLGKKRAGRREFAFYFSQWKKSYQPNFIINRIEWQKDEAPKGLRIDRPQNSGSELVVKWYADAPLSLLDIWLTKMEERQVPTFNIDVPTLHQLLTTLVPPEQIGPVRTRCLERAFAVCSRPFFLTFYDYGRPYPAHLATMIRNMPRLYYCEPGLLTKDEAWPKFNVEVASFLSPAIREAFYLRAPVLVNANITNTCTNLMRWRLYYDTNMIQACSKLWMETAIVHFPRDIAAKIYRDWIQPPLADFPSLADGAQKTIVPF